MNLATHTEQLIHCFSTLVLSHCHVPSWCLTSSCTGKTRNGPGSRGLTPGHAGTRWQVSLTRLKADSFLHLCMSQKSMSALHISDWTLCYHTADMSETTFCISFYNKTPANLSIQLSLRVSTASCLSLQLGCQPLKANDSFMKDLSSLTTQPPLIRFSLPLAHVIPCLNSQSTARQRVNGA